MSTERRNYIMSALFSRSKIEGLPTRILSLIAKASMVVHEHEQSGDMEEIEKAYQQVQNELVDWVLKK